MLYFFRNSTSVFAPVLVFALLATLVGCGESLPPRYKTRGKVVYKGSKQPFTQGMVYFESTKPPYHRAMAILNDKGEFELSTWRENEGALEGEHRVLISAGELAMTPAFGEWLKKIDKKYLDYGTSGIKVTVQPKHDNDIVIEITKPGEK